MVYHFSSQLPRRLGILITAHVSNIIDDGVWAWLSSNGPPLLDLIQHQMLGSPRVGCQDELRWIMASDYVFSVRSILQGYLEQRNCVPWLRFIDRITIFLPFPNRCFLCRANSERHRHLFF